MTQAHEAAAGTSQLNHLAFFTMPKPVAITGRTSSITNSFINSIIPVVVPTNEDVRAALGILGMTRHVVCAYCGDPFSEWDHLRPLVIDKLPTGFISEIHNLVPACGKCNQSKGNKHWRAWMFGPAKLSPLTRGVSGLDRRAERLQAYEDWMPPTQLDFAELVGAELWKEHWDHHSRILASMVKAQVIATKIRETIRVNHLAEGVAASRAEPGLRAP